MRICFVTPRYGPRLVGGAERQALEYAERLVGTGHEVSVLTTCATSHVTWDNDEPAGESVRNGVRVQRFPITRASDPAVLARLGGAIGSGLELPSAAQEEWILNTGYSELLLDAVAFAADSGNVLVFTPYLFASTVYGARVRPEQSIVIPCLHDEPYAGFVQVCETLRGVAGLIFNTDAEARLAARLLGSLPPHRTVGFGFDPPAATDPQSFRTRRHLAGDVVAYVGRREAGKNFPLLLECVTAYNVALSPENPVTLLLMGGGDYTVPRELRGHVLDLGFASPQDKFDALAASTVLANLSTNESFSHVLAEAWLVDAPVIVHSHCEVTRDHCEISGGGLWVDNVEAFAAALDRLRADRELHRRLGRAGHTYVTRRYSWPPVLERLTSAIAELAA